MGIGVENAHRPSVYLGIKKLGERIVLVLHVAVEHRSGHSCGVLNLGKLFKTFAPSVEIGKIR